MDISLLYLFQSKSLSQFQRNPSLCRFSLLDMSYVAFSMPYMSIDRILPNFYIAEARHFSFCLIECTCPKILRYPKTRQVTSLLPNIIVPGFILIVSVENCTSARGPLELNWARTLLETSRSRFLVSSLKLRTSRSHMSSALPSVLRFEVYVCTARARCRG